MKRDQKFDLRLSVTEKKELYNKAVQAGLSVSDYMRHVVFRYKIRSSYDRAIEMDLIKINADMARLGNLMNQWLKSQYHHDLALEFGMIDLMKNVLISIEDNQTNLKKELDYLARQTQNN